MDNAVEAPATATRIGRTLAWLALVSGLASGAAALLAGPAYRWHGLALGTALQTVRTAGTIAAIGAGLALLAGVLVWIAPQRRSLSVAAAALLVNALAAGMPMAMQWKGQHLPRIHDVSTDLVDPPAFVAVVPLREGARNPVAYASATAALQRAGYPDIVPQVLAMPSAQAFERAERTARALGWEIVAVAPAELRLEATDTTLLFGFKDDVVIRITPRGNASVVDVRSLSRVGGSDFGTNANRVRGFLRKLATN